MKANTIPWKRVIKDVANLPVTVICGYLGVGKTSYINNRLKEANGTRYAVLVNDFGELNIDAALIQSENENVIKLINGCVCCSISNDMHEVMNRLVEMSDEIDWVLLEASGVADGKKVKDLVLNWPGFDLIDCLTLVDVSRIQTLVRDKFVGAHVRQQIIEADKIKWTKTDLLDLTELEQFESWFENSFRVESKSLAKEGTSHPEYFNQVLRSETSLDRGELEAWLDKLDPSICRLKGFVYLSDQPETRFLLQYLESGWELTERAPWQSKPITELTVISLKPLALNLPDFVCPRSGSH